MRKFFKRSPLVVAVQSLKKEKISVTHFFYFFILTISIIIISKAVVPSLQKQFMRQYHLSTKSYLQWALLQAVPSMYNFANEFWVSSRPLDTNKLDDYQQDFKGGLHGWRNHYPFRYITFNFYREIFFSKVKKQYLYLRSEYRGLSLITSYEFQPKYHKLYIKPVKEEIKND